MSLNKHRFVAEFHEAESAIKKYERLSSETAIPSINELRYATYHVVEAIEAEENGQDTLADEMWDRAVRHARRAKFDVMEFHVALCMDRVEKAKESYAGYEALAASLIPSFFKHKKALRALASEIEHLTELDKESPASIKLCEKQIRIAGAFLRDFELAQDALFTEIERREAFRAESQSKEKKQTRISWLQCVVSAVLGTVLGGLVTWVFFC